MASVVVTNLQINDILEMSGNVVYVGPANGPIDVSTYWVFDAGAGHVGSQDARVAGSGGFQHKVGHHVLSLYTITVAGSETIKFQALEAAGNSNVTAQRGSYLIRHLRPTV